MEHGLVTEPVWDEKFQGWMVKQTDEWFVGVMPMIFNDRIVIGHRGDEYRVYEYGWCYDQGGAALLAAVAWNPDEEDEPAGYKKAAVGHRVRGQSRI